MANSTPALKKENEPAGEQHAWAAGVLTGHGQVAGGVTSSQNFAGRRKPSLAESAVFWRIRSYNGDTALGFLQSLDPPAVLVEADS